MTDAPAARLSATLLVARDGPRGVEIFMVVRHHQIDFASGALVFPGGSLDASDSDPRITELADGLDGLDEAGRALRVGAAREAFEECGVLLARPANGDGALVDGATATRLGALYRADLEAGRIGMADIAEREGLRLALDALVPFAHWITPTHMPKRFDTHFFVVAAPHDHVLAHDGHEAVDSVWITPADAISEADAGQRTVIFPTRLNLLKAGQAGDTVSEMLATCRTAPIVTVMPRMEKRGETRILHIPLEAGYGAAQFEVEATPAGSVPTKPVAIG